MTVECRIITEGCGTKLPGLAVAASGTGHCVDHRLFIRLSRHDDQCCLHSHWWNGEVLLRVILAIIFDKSAVDRCQNSFWKIPLKILGKSVRKSPPVNSLRILEKSPRTFFGDSSYKLLRDRRLSLSNRSLRILDNPSCYLWFFVLGWKLSRVVFCTVR